MKKFLVAVWNWLVTSSENPDEFSARFKGLMTLLAGSIALSLTFLGYPTTETAVLQYAAYLTQAGGVIYTFFGIIRYIANWIDNRVPPTV